MEVTLLGPSVSPVHAFCKNRIGTWRATSVTVLLGGAPPAPRDARVSIGVFMDRVWGVEL